MEALLAQLKDLLDLRDKARLALPGVLCGFLAMILFLPPRPIDWIPVVMSRVMKPPIESPTGIKERPFGRLFGRTFTPVLDEPACTIDEVELNPASQPTGLLFETHNKSAQDRQQVLEEQDENLDRCLAAERKLVGREESAIAALNVDLKALEASQGQQAALVADYEKAHSPLVNAAWGRGKVFDTAIQVKRQEIAKNQKIIRDRQWETGELTRWKSVVSDRLADPGKLRPQLGFDDYLSALSKHFLAFIVLSSVVGMLVECLSTPGMLKAMERFTLDTE